MGRQRSLGLKPYSIRLGMRRGRGAKGGFIGALLPLLAAGVPAAVKGVSALVRAIKHRKGRGRAMRGTRIRRYGRGYIRPY